MKNKKAESNLPSDNFTMTDGYNYGLDGFQFDTDYGSGVVDGARLPEVQGLAGLPDGIVSSEQEDFDIPLGVIRDEDDGIGDLTGMMVEGSLAGLGWLNGEQDPDRLPKNPVDRGQMELEEAWGVNRRTDGLQRVPGLDLSAVHYEASLKEEGTAKTASQEDLLRVVRRAMRRSAYGEPLQAIFDEAARELGHDAYRIKKAMRVVKAEHGLAGRVFIRASAFPGLHNGKWKDTIRRKCSSARYIIADDGRDVYGDILKMPVVKKVPWNDAYEFYTPRLKAAGYRVASDLKPQQALRKAFLSTPVVEHKHTAKPVETRLVDTITRKEARQAFAEAETLAQEIVDLTDREDRRVRQAAERKILQWVRGGLLSKEDGSRLKASSADPRTIIQTAADIIAAAGKTQYAGSGIDLVKPVSLNRKAAFEALSVAEKKVSQQQQKIDSAVARKAKLYVDRLHTAGALTSKDVKEVLSLKDPQEIMKKATFLAAAGRKTEVPTKVKKAKKYEGASFEAAPQKSASYKELSPETQRIIEASEASGIAVNEFRGMLRWTRQKMAEGFAGNDLTQLIDVRFTKPLLKAASTLISELRSEHEGLSGHLYVDAEAYASKSGQAGCEKGGNIHRANGIPFVLAMSRCGSCVFANADGGCQKYNKKLVDRLDEKEHKDYQREMIRQANASDAELTASVFASSYDPQEYSLDNESALDNFELETTPEHEDIGDVFFGGIEI